MIALRDTRYAFTHLKLARVLVVSEVLCVHTA